MKPFQCNIYNSSFAENGTLKGHIAAVHERKKPFQCNICDSSFTRNNSLTRHKAAVHEGTISMQLV